VDDLMVMANVAQGTETITACKLGDGDCSGEIAIDDILLANIGPESKAGAPFTCTGTAPEETISSVTEVSLAGAFTACDQPTIADIVVVNTLVGQ
jgi:hypothetical protein